MDFFHSLKINNSDWAPDIIYDKQKEDYIIHWSSSHQCNQFGPKAIFYTRTKDFKTFSKPEELFRKTDSGVIDSAMYEEQGRYYLFLKLKAKQTLIFSALGRFFLIYFQPLIFFLRRGDKVEKGRIIFLNGVTSAGKTSIVEAIQERDDVFFYVVANDLFEEMVGDKYLRCSSD